MTTRELLEDYYKEDNISNFVILYNARKSELSQEDIDWVSKLEIEGVI